MAANSWDIAKKLKATKSTPEEELLSYKDRQGLDLLNAVGADTQSQPYWQNRLRQPVTAKQRTGFSPENLQPPSPAAATNISAGPPIPASAGPRIPMVNMPAWSPPASAQRAQPTVVAAPEEVPFNRGLPGIPADPSLDPEDRFREFANAATGYGRNVTNEGAKQVKEKSGMFNSNLNRLNTDYKGVRTQSTLIPHEKYLEMENEFRESPEIARIRENQQKARDILLADLEHRKSMPDLSVLKDFAKNISGGRVTMDGYNAPKQNLGAEAAIALLNGENKNELDLLRQAADVVKNRKDGTLLESIGQQNFMQAEEGAKDPYVQPRSTGVKPYNPRPDLEKLQRKLQPFVGMQSKISRFKALLEQNLGKPLSQYDPKKDNISGLGAFSSMNFSDESRSINSAWQEILNQALSDTGGKALTPAEMALVKKAKEGNKLGIADEKTQIEALAAIERGMKKSMRQAEAFISGTPEGPEVLRMYKDEDPDVVLSRDIPEPDYGNFSTAIDKKGAGDLSAKEKELADLKAKRLAREGKK